MAKYLIDGSTLTAIADAIRENSPNSWIGQSIRPEQMPQCIEDCYYDGYDDGYEDGKADGGVDLEALGALCDWQVATNSDSWPVITIVNYHPSYYLHCAIYDDGGSQMYDPDTDIYFDGVSVVVPPNSSRSVAFDQRFSNSVPLYVESVRWKASAT